MAAEAATGGNECALGLLRTKPGRGERTSCMSCSDKLAKWLYCGLQGSMLSLLMPRPIYFSSYTIGEPCSIDALKRALVRRGNWSISDYASWGVDAAAASPVVFEHSAQARGDEATPCTNSILWNANGLHEAINGMSGKKMGANKKSPSPKHRSAVCKALLWEAFQEVLRTMREPVVDHDQPYSKGLEELMVVAEMASAARATSVEAQRLMGRKLASSYEALKENSLD